MWPLAERFQDHPAQRAAIDEAKRLARSRGWPVLDDVRPDTRAHRQIIVWFETVEHERGSKKFDTLASARAYAHRYVGTHPDIGRHYAVSHDGIVTVRVEGATLADLFPSA